MFSFFSTSVISPPQEAATVVLLREGPSPEGGIQVYMMRRRGSLRFAPDHSVFPGGKLDPEDRSPRVLSRCTGLSEREATSVLTGRPEGPAGLGYWVAAVRELFEETGILLSTPALPPDTRERARAALLTGALTWREFLEEDNLTCDTSALRYLGRWITPSSEPIRYDTRFFVARLPAGQEPREGVPGTAGESVAAEWVTPRQALTRWEKREMIMLPPTATTLRYLTQFHSLEEVWENGVRGAAFDGIPV